MLAHSAYRLTHSRARIRRGIIFDVRRAEIWRRAGNRPTPGGR